MGQKSTKENKKSYQLAREDAGLSREAASEALDNYLSASRIEKIENNKATVHPDEILKMAEAYKKPGLCHEFCTKECAIGKKFIPSVEISNLAQITLGMLSTLNSVEDDKNRLIDITADGQISEDEYRDFAMIEDKLEKISLAVSALQLWIQQEIACGNIDQEKLEQYRTK